MPSLRNDHLQPIPTPQTAVGGSFRHSQSITVDKYTIKLPKEITANKVHFKASACSGVLFRVDRKGSVLSKGSRCHSCFMPHAALPPVHCFPSQNLQHPRLDAPEGHSPFPFLNSDAQTLKHQQHHLLCPTLVQMHITSPLRLLLSQVPAQSTHTLLGCCSQQQHGALGCHTKQPHTPGLLQPAMSFGIRDGGGPSG